MSRVHRWTTGCAAALLVAAASPRISAQEATLPAAVKSHNGRLIGMPAWREVSLQVRRDGHVLRSYTIVNAWQRYGDSIRTLFHLRAPKGLAGTSVLLEEPSDGAGPMDVHLFLPAGRQRVMRVLARLYDDNLLGTEFSYRDFRWRLPTTVAYARADRLRIGTCDTIALRAAYTESRKWASATYYVCPRSWMVVGIDSYASAHDALPQRRLRVERMAQRGGIWTPTRIRVWYREGLDSVLELQRFRFEAPEMPEEMFRPEALPTLARMLNAYVSD